MKRKNLRRQLDYDFAIIGAGVVGLAVAARLSPQGRAIVLEKETKFGQATSSRNSEVVHAGLYYSPGSLKAQLCVRGRQIIETLAEQKAFAYAQIGKYVVAVDEREQGLLKELKSNAQACQISDLVWADMETLRIEEPEVRAKAALFSPRTGIVDSHGMMDYFRREAFEAGTDFAFDTEVKEIKRSELDRGYEVKVSDSSTLSARYVINAAGLYSDRIAEMAGMDVVALGLELRWSRGVYYGLDGEAGLKVRHLVYPVPDRARASLGVHACLDLAGGIRFGPTAEPMSEKIEDYSPPHSGLEAVAKGVSRYLPRVEPGSIHPLMVGIRPKLSGPGEPVRDFYISEESGHGLPGFINLIGIESPGLTAAPAIARYVAGLINLE